VVQGREGVWRALGKALGFGEIETAARKRSAALGVGRRWLGWSWTDLRVAWRGEMCLMRMKCRRERGVRRKGLQSLSEAVRWVRVALVVVKRTQTV
jgi:hypothetical protein